MSKRRPRCRPWGMGLLAGAVIATTAFTTGPAQAVGTHNMLIVAHRGGDDWGPESTLVSFRHAIAAGAQAIEFDVWWTADHVPVVMHDPTVDRTTNCKGPVADYTWAELQQCDAGGGQQVPSLDEALQVIADGHVLVFVHCKLVNNQRQAEAIMRDIDKYGLNDGTWATTIADNEVILHRMYEAGSNHLGLVFNNPQGWDARYPVLLAYNTVVTRRLVARAHRHGAFVMTVQDHGLTLDQLVHRDYGLDGFFANHIDQVLERLRRYRPTGDGPDGYSPGLNSNSGNDGESSTGTGDS
jgi:Glycerophosphoryl diester phosphodiesterase family